MTEFEAKILCFIIEQVYKNSAIINLNAVYRNYK